MGKGDKLIVELSGGPPWGFRLGGGSDFGCALEIAKLRNRSKAQQAGLQEGDVVIEIDHQDVSTKSHGDAMKIIELAGPTLRLIIVKGIGPSADLVNISMSDSVDAVHLQSALNGLADSQMHQPKAAQFQQQPPKMEAVVIKSREPSVSRSYIETRASREPSISRSITIISKGSKQASTPISPAVKPKADPWTVNVESFKFAAPSSSSAPKPQSMSIPQPSTFRQPPPISPKPKFDAKAATQANERSPAWSFQSPPASSLNHNPWITETDSGPSPAMALQRQQPRAQSMFRVSKAPVQNTKPDRWQPSTAKVAQQQQQQRPCQDSPQVQPHQPPPSYAPAAQPSYNQPNYNYQSPQANLAPLSNYPQHQPSQRSTIPEPPPPMMSPPKSANHVPGMINPLICDDSQGDFGMNSLVRPSNDDEGPLKEKKIYSDSAFYDTPGETYPTIHEQVKFCKEIAHFLESNQNQRSRGGRMFMKRKERADDWSMNSQGQRRPQQSINSIPYDSPDAIHNMPRREYNQVRHHPDPIKSKIDAQELEIIQHNMESLCKHDTLPPNMAFDINTALGSSHGKAGKIFAKRKQRAEKYIVDDSNVKQFHTPSNSLQIKLNQQYGPSTPQVPYQSPWEAAMEDRLAVGKNPPNPAPKHQMQPPATSRNQPIQQAQAPLEVKYKTVKPVSYTLQMSGGRPAGVGFSQTLPRQKTRLESMIEGGSGTSRMVFDTSQPTNNNYLSSNYNNSSVGGSSYLPAAAQSYQSVPSTTPGHQNQQSFTPGFSATLRRPKDYVQPSGRMGTSIGPAPVSAF